MSLPTNRAYLQMLDGSTLEVDPQHPDAVVLNPHADIHPDYGGGWGEVRLSDPDSHGRRKAVFLDARRTFTVTPEGRFETRAENDDGDWQRMVFAEQPYTKTHFRDVLAFVPFDPPAYGATRTISVTLKVIPIQQPA